MTALIYVLQSAARTVRLKFDVALPRKAVRSSTCLSRQKKEKLSLAHVLVFGQRKMRLPTLARAILSLTVQTPSRAVGLLVVVRHRSVPPVKLYVLPRWWVVILLFSLPLSAQHVPPGTILEARLSIATGSRISHPGDRIQATIIAPASVGGHIVIPDGSVLSGVIENVNRLGP